jgi:hypothetical protein
MLPSVILNLAWAEGMRWTPTQVAELLLDIKQANMVPAAEGKVCPQCRRDFRDSEGYVFDPEPAMTPDRVNGRMLVRCLCRTAYWYTEVRVFAPEPAPFQPALTVPSVRPQMDERAWSYPGARAFYISIGMGMGPDTPLPLRATPAPE